MKNILQLITEKRANKSSMHSVLKICHFSDRLWFPVRFHLSFFSLNLPFINPYSTNTFHSNPALKYFFSSSRFKSILVCLYVLHFFVFLSLRKYDFINFKMFLYAFFYSDNLFSEMSIFYISIYFDWCSNIDLLFFFKFFSL